MQADVIPIGNSRGVIIPSAIIEALGVTHKLNIELKQGAVLLRPTQPRKGWEEAFSTIAQGGDDDLLIPSVFDDEPIAPW